MKTVFVSGVFDVLHAGHLQFFREARALGDHLTVCAASGRYLAGYKGRVASMPDEHKRRVLAALKMVDEAVIGDDQAADGMDFKSRFLERLPDILAVTEDDKFQPWKQQLCLHTGGQYVVLPKTPPDCEPISTTEIRQRITCPQEVPVRVDFAGGWLDVPRFARADGRVINLAVTPGVSLGRWPYEKQAGLGGSAAWKLLSGEDPVKFDLSNGCGWQDAAIIRETGLCVWASGAQPSLISKTPGGWLRGKLALHYAGPRATDKIPYLGRDYERIARIASHGANAVAGESISLLADVMNMARECQTDEGMAHLPAFGQLAAKYCGAGHGGYAVYLFESEATRDSACKSHGLIAVEPYLWSVL